MEGFSLLEIWHLIYKVDFQKLNSKFKRQYLDQL
jgi:hypothetical protein